MLDIDKLFPSLPTTLRNELVLTFNKIVVNYSRGKWEPAELNGGKFCEVVYSVIKGCADGSMPATASKPNNMVDACRSLEAIDIRFPRSLRIQIPRMLIALYEVRNNRGVGHIGGDISPNKMDSVLVLYNAKWIFAELIRFFHGLDTESAQGIVDSLVEREVPIVWMAGAVKRVLASKLTMKEQMLVLLYSGGDAINEKRLVESIEPRNITDFRNKVIKTCHKERLVEYNDKSKDVTISPKGEKYVEEVILSSVGLK